MRLDKVGAVTAVLVLSGVAGCAADQPDPVSYPAPTTELCDSLPVDALTEMFGQVVNTSVDVMDTGRADGERPLVICRQVMLADEDGSPLVLIVRLLERTEDRSSQAASPTPDPGGCGLIADVDSCGWSDLGPTAVVYDGNLQLTAGLAYMPDPEKGLQTVPAEATPLLAEFVNRFLAQLRG